MHYFMQICQYFNILCAKNYFFLIFTAFLYAIFLHIPVLLKVTLRFCKTDCICNAKLYLKHFPTSCKATHLLKHFLNTPPPYKHSNPTIMYTFTS